MTKQKFEIGPHFGHLVLGHQREQGDMASKDQGKAHFNMGINENYVICVF